MQSTEENFESASRNREWSEPQKHLCKHSSIFKEAFYTSQLHFYHVSECFSLSLSLLEHTDSSKVETFEYLSVCAVARMRTHLTRCSSAQTTRREGFCKLHRLLIVSKKPSVPWNAWNFVSANFRCLFTFDACFTFASVSLFIFHQSSFATTFFRRHAFADSSGPWNQSNLLRRLAM